MNRLYNGTFYERLSPTSFAPLLLGNVPPVRVPGMLALLADPAKFCVNDTHLAGILSAADHKRTTANTARDSTATAAAAGGAAVAVLWRMAATGQIAPAAGDSVTCASEACLASTVLASADFQAVEAMVAVQPLAPPDATVELVRYQEAQTTGRTLLAPANFSGVPSGCVRS